MQQQPRLPLWFLVANWALVVAAFVLGVVLGGRGRMALPEPQDTALRLIHAEILKSHVDPHDGHVLLDRAIENMVASLDPYSRYVPPSEVAAYDERNSGHYEGVGLVPLLHDGEVLVQYPLPDGPAERAGVLPGDRIVAIDGRRLADEPPATRGDLASRLLRGAAGTEVRLLLGRDDGTVERSLQRGDVEKSAVKWVHFADSEAGLAYVYLSDFHRGIQARIAEALAELGSRQTLHGLVLDLRFDGGGNLDECVALARMFVRSGTIVSQRRRGSEVVETFAAEPEACTFPDLPLVVLVNQDSASASEVLAGALQDHERAAIVGTRTFGKGFVNTVYTWQGLDFRLKLTTGNYYTPNGRNIDGHHRNGGSPENGGAASAAVGGIVPDVTAEVAAAELPRIRSVLERLEPPQRHLAAFTAVATRYGLDVPKPPQADTDPQLAQALATLRERVAAAAAAARAPEAGGR